MIDDGFVSARRASGFLEVIHIGEKHWLYKLKFGHHSMCDVLWLTTHYNIGELN